MKIDIQEKQLMFAGPSGVGKTTLAKYFAETYYMDYISVSYRDLLSQEDKDLNHNVLLLEDKKSLQEKDWSLLNLRNKAFKKQIATSTEGIGFVSDRSYLDSAAYFVSKQNRDLPPCEIEHFIATCKMLLGKQCSHLVFIPYTKQMMKDFVIEDDNKRITNKYYQFEISKLMQGILEDLLGMKFITHIHTLGNGFLKKQTVLRYGAEAGIIESIYGTTQVLILNEIDLELRKETIEKWIVEPLRWR